MSVYARFNSLLRNLAGGRRVERALDDELQAYLDLLTQDKIAAGMSLEEARRAACIEIGGVEQVKERVRAVRETPFTTNAGRNGTMAPPFVPSSRFCPSPPRRSKL